MNLAALQPDGQDYSTDGSQMINVGSNIKIQDHKSEFRINYPESGS
ncbi:hypothetical protein RSX31_09495 [Rossellomorea sp. YC4-1]|nr:hypothetical protein [Rossellomorea sp. YC4-1]